MQTQPQSRQNEPESEFEAGEKLLVQVEERRWIDNVFIERVWRSLMYEEVYLRAY